MKRTNAPLIGSMVLALIGLILVFGPLLHLLNLTPVHANIFIFHHVIHTVNVVSLPIIGIILVYMATYVYRRRRLAAILSTMLCVMLFAYLLILYPHGKITPPVALLTILYVVIIVSLRSEFTIKNNLDGIWLYLRRILTIMIIGFLYGVVGFHFFSHLFFRSDFSLLTCIDLTIDSLTGFSGTTAEPTKVGGLFIDSLGGIGIVIFILLLDALFRPLRFRVLSHHRGLKERVEKIIRNTSRSSEDFFKLWPDDKSYFFSTNRKAFIAYKHSGHTVIVLGDPTGDRRNSSSLIKEFLVYCRMLGWSVAVVNASNKGRVLFEKQGLTSLFVGNEGIIDIGHFMEKTRKNKHFRYVSNRATRDILEVEEWQTLTPERWSELKNISRKWLSRGGRREYGFFMGYFDHQYLKQCRVFVLMQNQQPIAYTNLIPTFHKGHASLDHLRNKVDTSPVGMHFLLMKVIETLNEEENKSLNIGLAPLSGISKHQTELFSRAALRCIRLLGASYYSFEGLGQFKGKFEPYWEPRAILYSGTPASLIRVARDIEHASAYGLRGTRPVFLSAVGGIIVLTLGLYLILS